MKNRYLRHGLVIFICYAVAYTPILRAEQIALPVTDLIAPEIIQENYQETLSPGEDHEIVVNVTDNVGVRHVTLYYRTINTEAYKSLSMQNIAGTNDYKVSINSEQIKLPGIEYYVQAADVAGNSLLHGYSFSPISAKMVDKSAVTNSESSTAYFEAEESSSIWSNKWLWIGIGVLAAGAVAGGGSGSGSGTTAAQTGDVTATW